MRSSPSEREGDAVLDRELCPLMQYEPRRTLIFREGTVVTYIKGSSGFLVDVRPTPAPSCSFCGTGIDHCAL